MNQQQKSRAVIGATLCVAILTVLYTHHKILIDTTEVSGTQHNATVFPYDDISEVRFFEGANFYNTVARHPKNDTSVPARGILVPHHLVADDIIADLFAYVSNQEISRIVLIGPNHFELGRAKVTTSRNAWSSPVGIVPPDLTFIDSLLTTSATIQNDPSVMKEEHAHASIMPFIAYYLPNVPVVPLALSMKLTRTDMDELIDRLVAADDGTTLYVATVDFSHYLSASEAQNKDNETRSLILSRNTDALFRLTSQHIDSPRSLIVIMETLKNLGYSSINIITNTNTSDYIYDYTGEVTSYFGISFEK